MKILLIIKHYLVSRWKALFCKHVAWEAFYTEEDFVYNKKRCVNCGKLADIDE